ncbi:hypothetical protein LTR53_007448, partial [Teratosphaeriaceae sp. CCFEE 6253]
MHAIKKAARREAWYNSDETDQTRQYNPFSRASTNQRRRAADTDVEAGNPNSLSHVQTENDVGPSPIEARRKEQWSPNSGPNKAPTFPSGPSGQIPERRAEESEKSDDYISSEVKSSKGSSDKPLSNGSTDDPIADPSTSADGARNRK